MKVFKQTILKLGHNFEEFLFQFQSHPNHPSALAFSDTLNFLGIKNDAYELEKEYWDELPKEFITLYNNNFALVQRNGSQANVITNEVEIIPFEKLKEQSINFILLFEKTATENHSQSKNTLSYFILIVVIGVLLLSNWWSWNLWSFLFQLLSLAGVYIFLEIFKQKFGSESPVLQSFCEVGSKQKTTEDTCEKIIQSKDFELFGLKFSDYGFVYFVAILLLPLIISKTSVVFLVITSLSLFSIIYSVYYQILKKIFCRICVLAIAILVLQFSIAYFHFQDSFLVTELLVALFNFLVSFFVIHSFSKLIEEKEEFKNQNIKNLRFKRNYDLFKRELTDNEKIEFTDKQAFFIGNGDAKIHISVVSNPYCGFCKDAHKILEDLLKKYPNEISAQMRFNYSSERTDEKYTQLISDFLSIYKNKSQKEFLNSVDAWFKNKDESEIKRKSGTENHEDLSNIIRMTAENSFAGLTFTPVFIINGYKFPDKYDREDIHYFISELIEDEDFNS